MMYVQYNKNPALKKYTLLYIKGKLGTSVDSRLAAASETQCSLHTVY